MAATHGHIPNPISNGANLQEQVAEFYKEVANLQALRPDMRDQLIKELEHL